MTKTQLIALLRQYAQRYGIDEQIAIAQIQQESEFDPRAGSPAGAQGIAQFIPATAARFGVNVWDVNSSFDGWGRYMRLMLDMFGGRYDLALAGYNSGENRAEYRNAAAQNRPINWRVLPARVQSETQHYVNKILGGASVYSNPAPVEYPDNPSIPSPGVFDWSQYPANEWPISWGIDGDVGVDNPWFSVEAGINGNVAEESSIGGTGLILGVVAVVILIGLSR